MRLCLLAILLCSQENTPKYLIEKLRSENIEERHKALSELRRLGESAREALTQAAREIDKELASQATALLAELNNRLAERRFGDIEEKILRAASIRTRLHFEFILTTPSGDKARIAGTGKLSFKNPNRILAEREMDQVTPLGGNSLVISDGGRVAAKGDWEDKLSYFPTPDNLKDNMALHLVRAGQVAPHSSYTNRMLHRLGEGAGLFVKTLFPVSDFTDGGTDGTSAALSYTLTFDAGKARVTLWYDPHTLTLRKRSMKVTWKQGPDTVLNETYDEFTIGTDIPDDIFKLPNRGK